ncbi:MAG: hypothetical protein HYU37_22490 [Acidobacteria bacterium]|nr:hypothetical protein [Acidobacteriota bacterium]
MKAPVFVLSCVLLVSTSAWAGPAVRYAIEADVDVRRHVIAGTETVAIANTTTAPLQELYLVLYPNQFRTKNARLNEMNYLWHYPSGFDEGSLTVSAIRVTGSNQTLQGQLIDPPGLPPGTVLRIPLSPALQPGAELSLAIAFETKVPHKYGPFGHFRDTMTAQGGWYPYLVPLADEGRPLFDGLPQRSSVAVHLKLSAERDALVNGVFFDDVSEIDLPARDASYVSLVLAPEYYPTTREAASTKVTFYSLEKARYKINPIMDGLVQTATAASSFFSIDAPREVVFAETYLRAVMTFPGEDMVLVSDRFFVTVTQFDMRNLNTLEAARATAVLAIADRVADREDPRDANWVTEALAWEFRNAFLKENFKELSNLRETANSMGMFRPFHRMAASPTIPFSETYVGFVVNRDPFRESLQYFNNTLPSGQVFTEKMPGTIGAEPTARAVKSYLHQDRRFEPLVAQVAGQDMTWFFAQWKQGYPPDLDYRLAGVKRNAAGAGYKTAFTVEKVTNRDLVDPVEVRVQTDGAPSKLLTWDGRGSAQSFEVETAEKVTQIEIDPRRQTAQTDDYNDLAPHRWEMVMDRGDVDVGSGGLGAGMRIRMHKVRDQGRWMFALPFFAPAEVGVEAGMLFNFGGIVDGLVWNRKQELSMSYLFTDLRGGFANEKSGARDGSGQSSALKFRYTFQNKMFEEDPMNFEAVEAAVSVYREEIGSDFNFFQATLSASKAVALHPKHKLAGLVTLAHSDGFRSEDEIPAQKLFDLSGVGVSGIAAAGNHLGTSAAGVALEWRHDLMSNLNMAMPMNMRIRRLQGVLAFESGWVANDFEDLFRVNQGIYGIRYGLRFHYDFLGIRPSDFTVDVGHRLGAPRGRVVPDDGLVFSIGILQTF